MFSIAVLTLVAFVAGLIDSIAGGGGLLTIPSLLVAGLPPQMALGTSKFVSLFGTTAALINFARGHLVQWRLACIGIPFSLIGAAAGSRCVMALDSATAGKVIIALLPVAALVTLIPRRERPASATFTRMQLWGLVPLICFAVGFYDGFFGPGAGSFFILAFYVGLRLDLIKATATAKVFNLASNIGAIVVFVSMGQLMYAYALPMCVANILGNTVGSQIAMRVGARIVRVFLGISLGILFATLIWKYV